MKVELTEKTVCAGREVELIKITEDVKETVKSSRVKDGVVFIISAHTTAGITMNEGLPCVEKDLSWTKWYPVTIFMPTPIFSRLTAPQGAIPRGISNPCWRAATVYFP